MRTSFLSEKEEVVLENEWKIYFHRLIFHLPKKPIEMTLYLSLGMLPTSFASSTSSPSSFASSPNISVSASSPRLDQQRLHLRSHQQQQQQPQNPGRNYVISRSQIVDRNNNNDHQQDQQVADQKHEENVRNEQQLQTKNAQSEQNPPRGIHRLSRTKTTFFLYFVFYDLLIFCFIF